MVTQHAKLKVSKQNKKGTCNTHTHTHAQKVKHDKEKNSGWLRAHFGKFVFFAVCLEIQQKLRLSAKFCF